MQSTLYFYSATGNSYLVAREIAGKLGGASLLPLVPLASKKTAAGEITGLVFPVYDWNLPLIVGEFLKKLDVSGVRYFYAVATCNYLQGRALDRVGDLLLAKGLKLNAGFTVRMPGTYLPLYGANSPRTQKKKLAAMALKTDRIAAVVGQRADHRLERSPAVFDRLLASKMAAHMEGFPDKDRDFTVDDACGGCGTCKKVCPFGNIEMAGGRPQWLHKCQQCLACVHFCPKDCIQLGNKTRGRKRYKNPVVPLKDIIALASSAQD